MHWREWRTGICFIIFMRFVIACKYVLFLLRGLFPKLPLEQYNLRIVHLYLCAYTFSLVALLFSLKLKEFVTMRDWVMQDGKNYTVARDTFLAHLGATLWGSLRHIISPSTSDGAFHYYEKISFQLFFITQEVCFVGRRLLYIGYLETNKPSSFLLFFPRRELKMSSSCLLILKVSWMGFPPWYYRHRKWCLVSIGLSFV